MAGKGRRTASRQAQLNRKRKRTQKGPSGIPSTDRRVADSDAEEAVAVAAGVEDAELEAPEAPEAPEAIGASGGPAVSVGDVPATPRASRPPPVVRTARGEFAGQGQGRLRGERPAAYLYVGAEFRRIMVLTGAILAALIVLGIVL